MGRNRKLKARIAALGQRVQQHEHKIQQEQQRSIPDVGLIGHWQAELNNWKKQMDHAKQRLERQR